MAKRYRCTVCGYAGHDGAAGEPGAALDHTTCGPMTEAIVFKVGDAVTLHHAKAKGRKRGIVRRVGRTRINIEVPWAIDGGTTITTRRIDDPDLRLVHAAA